ncbi:phage tail protein I [Candidatus Tokpelaia sp.]|uniref:phage tail protein I n=1 Tax=Candidatus Tokpelaia sp. TaxID=2233777 RepID=UPI0016800B33|nr:phage tail protein I [Candidatus Tokpelaia sp.]
MAKSLTGLKTRLDPKTLPPVVANGLTAALTKAAARQLDEPDFRLVMAEFIDTAPSASLPALVRELSLEDLIEPGMREDIVRGLLKRTVELHAAKGTVAGVRAVLALLGAKADWQQWYLQSPKGEPGTHKVVVFPESAVFNNGDPILSPRTAALVRRAISNYKRKSQDITIYQGLTNKGAVYPACVAASSRKIAIYAPQLGNQTYQMPYFSGAWTAAIRRIRINMKGSLYG